MPAHTHNTYTRVYEALIIFKLPYSQLSCCHSEAVRESLPYLFLFSSQYVQVHLQFVFSPSQNPQCKPQPSSHLHN